MNPRKTELDIIIDLLDSINSKLEKITGDDVNQVWAKLNK